MKPWPLLLAACLWVGAVAPGVAANADHGPIGDKAWCEASWHGLAKAGATRGESFHTYLDRCLAPCSRGARPTAAAHSEKDPAWCQARWIDLRLSGRAGGQTFDQFMSRCDNVCRAPPQHTAQSAAPSSTAGYLTPGLIIASQAVFAASLTGRRDQPASP